jgi:hypothetical protein
VSALGLRAVAAIALPGTKRRQERARALCLTKLLWQLAERQVDAVTLESRGSQRRDDDDARVIGGGKRAGTVPKQLVYGHAQPKVEPLLWLGDLVASALTAGIAGEDTTCLAALELMVETIEIGPVP